MVAIGTQFQYLGDKDRRGFARRLPLDHASIHRDLRRGVLSVVHASLMMRTAAVRAVGGFRFAAGGGEDWELGLRLAEIGRFGNLPDLGYLYRVHATNTTALHRQLTQRRIQFACVCAEARRLGLPEPQEETWLASLAQRPWHERWREAADSFAVARYYRARYLVLYGRPLRGYANLALSMVASPHRVANRLANRIAGFTDRSSAVRSMPT